MGINGATTELNQDFYFLHTSSLHGPLFSFAEASSRRWGPRTRLLHVLYCSMTLMFHI